MIKKARCARPGFCKNGFSLSINVIGDENVSVRINCDKVDCVWRFSNGSCTRKNLRVDDIGTCHGQETVNRLMTQYPGSQSPGVSHGGHGYAQKHGRVIR